MRVLIMKMCHLIFTKSLSNNHFYVLTLVFNLSNFYKENFSSEISMVH